MRQTDVHRGRCYLTTLCMTMTLIMAAAVMPEKAVAGEATLTWNPNTESDLAGYKVYYGTQAGTYSQVTNVGNVTTYVISGLTEGSTYYFAVTAYDTSGNESGSSAEVSKTFVDTTPPVISAIAATNISNASAVISWSTDEPATSQVEYGTTTAYGSTITLSPSFVTSHSQTLNGLQSATLYHYRVWSVDAANNVSISGDNTFTTGTTLDTTPPVLSNIASSNITGTGAVITWATDEAATSQVDYGTTTGYGTSTALDTTLVTSHSQTLGGLVPLTTYHYQVRSQDGAGNPATSGDFSFTTASSLQMVLIAAGSDWTYLDDGTDQGTAWRELSYDDSSWSSGAAQLGYGDGDEATVVGYGSDASNKHITTYFRYLFSLAEASGVTDLTLDLLRDDGAAVHLNDQEVARSNMPGGAITAETLATGVVGGTAEETFYSYAIDPSVLVDGTNIIAVEIHQWTGTSSDISFDLTLTATGSVDPDVTPPVLSNITASNVASTSAVITWATDEAATSEVEYGMTTAYGFSSAGTTLVMSHSRTLSGLTSSTTYNYRVKSSDGAGNLVTSGNFTFTTPAASDTTPPGDVQNFTALPGNQQITLSWVNPADSDFLGVRIRYRTDRFPVGINDGVLLGDFTGVPNENVSTTHTGLQNGVMYYYAASSYDLAGNYQSTARASATPSSINQGNQPTAGGGCGMIKLGDGDFPGPGQFLLNLLPSFLLIFLVGLLKWFRKVPSFIKRACHVCIYPEVPISALSCVRPAVLLGAFSLGWGGHTLLERQQ